MSGKSPPNTDTLENIKTVLGFDYGTRRIGVAVGQTVTRTANPLVILKARNGVPRWEEVTGILDEWLPEALVVGIPIHMDNATQPLTHAAIAFGQQLHQRYHLPVYGADERLTTRESRSRIQESDSKSVKFGHLDALAAQITLQSWLNNNRILYVDQFIS